MIADLVIALLDLADESHESLEGDVQNRKNVFSSKDAWDCCNQLVLASLSLKLKDVEFEWADAFEFISRSIIHLQELRHVACIDDDIFVYGVFASTP